jgi:hypothetical protein
MYVHSHSWRLSDAIWSKVCGLHMALQGHTVDGRVVCARMVLQHCREEALREEQPCSRKWAMRHCQDTLTHCSRHNRYVVMSYEFDCCSA